MISCVVFDFDGTLVDSNSAKRKAFYDVLVPMGIDPHELDVIFEENPDADRHGIMERAARKLNNGSHSSEELAVLYSDRAFDLQVQAPEIEGASEVLEALAVKLPVYVNSATPEEALQRVIDLRGWTKFFRGVYGRPRSKVDNLNRIMAAEKIDCRNLVMVGDQKADEFGAQACGCHFIGLGGDLNPVPRLHAQTLAGVIQLIKAL